MIVTANNAGRILVVDDQPANLRVVSALLSRHGYEVDNAADGPTALAVCEQRAPDLVLLDMMMPGMDGFGLIAQLKQREQLLRIPVVFLTAAHDRDLLLRAFDAGAVDYVTKPFTPEELLARVSAHIGLKLTRDRLERVARERQELVNLVAHDLKNPLTSVLFASDLLLSQGTRPERIPHYLQMIRESAEDALGYIHRYLELQSAAEQARSLDAEPPACGLREALQWLVRRYEIQLEARGIRLGVRMPNDEVHVAMDGLVLRQVAENLVTNAIKYAQGGGELELSVRVGAQGYWQLVAQDRGPGISEYQQRDLFKPFVRLGETAIDGDPLSSGLGLSLARQIVANAGGHLWYEDREGGGARFIIELPEARTVSAARDDASALT